MTISTLLGRGDAPVSRFELSGAGAMGDGGILHYLDRGGGGGGGGHAHGGGAGGGGGKGEKGTRSAISALTLLAFLFFINLLQNCLKESMMSQSAMTMMPAAVAAGGGGMMGRRHTRDVHDGSVTNLEEINALPGPGVYWDSNVLVRQKGDLDSADEPALQFYDSEDDEEYQHISTNESTWRNDKVSFTVQNQSGSSATEEAPERDASTDRSYQHFSNPGPNEKEEEDYDDYEQNEGNISTNESTWRNDKVSFTVQNQSGPSATEEAPERDVSTVRSYQHFSNPGLSDKEEEDWDYFQFDDDEASLQTAPSLTRDLSTSDPTGSGFVNDRYEEDSSVLYMPTSFGGYAWRVVTSVSNSLLERVQSYLNFGQCSELVVCEAHRMGKAWGTSGMLVASGISEVMLWMYGNDNEHRRLVMEAASTGREGHSCRMQIQQCEDKSRDRSALPFLAMVLEQLI